MPLDLSGFNTGEQTFPSLYKIGDDIRRNKELALRQQQLQQQTANENAVRKNATANYLKSYLDPKHFLTGTVYDPVITTGVNGIMNKAMSLISQGADIPTVSTIINSDVANLSKASENIKALNAQKLQDLANLGSVKGFDKQKFNDAYDNAAFYNTDANGNRQLRDLTSLDPTQDITDNVLRNGDVYNREGIDEFMKNSKPLTSNYTTKTRDAKGRLVQATGTITAPNFLTPDVGSDGVLKGFVPKFQIATEGDSPLIHTFKDETGKDVQAPVRMVTDDVWNATPPNVKAYVRQEVMKAIKDHPDIKLSSPQAENLAKSFLYDEMKNSPYNSGSFKRTDVNMQPLPPRVSVSIKNSQDVPTVDVFTPLHQMIEEKTQNKEGINSGRGHILGATRVNSLDDVTQGVIMDQLKSKYGSRFTPTDIYVAEPPDRPGGIGIYNAADDTPLMSLSPQGASMSANKNLGVKSKQKGLEQAKQTPKAVSGIKWK